MDRWQRAETAAERYLLRRGWYPVSRNWRCAAGEIDIIMRRLGILAIVEVKSRGDPRALLEPVAGRQRERLIRATEWFLASRADLIALEIRFDVIAVDTSRRPARITHLRDAFRAPDPRTTAAPPHPDTPSTGRIDGGSA